MPLRPPPLGDEGLCGSPPSSLPDHPAVSRGSPQLLKWVNFASDGWRGMRFPAGRNRANQVQMPSQLGDEEAG